MNYTILGPSFSAVVASGPVYPHRFVKYATTDYEVVQCGAHDMPDGVSQEGASLPPTDENYSTSTAGGTGDLIAIYGVGRTCTLEIGSTVSVGELLGPDADGKGIPYSSGYGYGAIAKSGGVSGDLIQVIVNPGEAA